MTQKHLWHFLLIVFVLVWSIVAMTPITNRDLLKDFQEKARSKDETYSNIVARAQAMLQSLTRAIACDPTLQLFPPGIVSGGGRAIAISGIDSRSQA